LGKVDNYKSKWVWHVCRMDRSRLPITYDIPTSRKEEPRMPITKFWTVILRPEQATRPKFLRVW
jgi:hypothetical protein